MSTPAWFCLPRAIDREDYIMTTPSGPGTRRCAYLLTSAALALVAAVAITLVLVVRPAPQTGDTEADAACYALAQATLSDGSMSGAKLGTLSDDERREIVREVMQHAERSTIEAIRRAGTALGAANAVGAVPLPDGSVGLIMAVDQFRNACGRHGWSPQRAGLTGMT
jgi:hypothetical protein